MTCPRRARQLLRSKARVAEAEICQKLPTDSPNEPFKLTVGEGKPKPLGRTGLSEQIMLAAKRSSPWLDAWRPQDGKPALDKMQADRLKAAPAVQRQARV
jgi:hypothetical protein